MSINPRLFFATLAVGLLAGHGAFAAKPAVTAREMAKERQAKKACLSGDYAKGVSILADLFLETEDAVYLYNQGRCFEQNVRYVEAAERFREYLRKAGTITDDIRTDVNKHIADCETGAAKTQTHVAAEVAPPPVQPAAPPTAQPAPISSPPVDPVRPLAETSSTSSTTNVEYPWQHTAKWIATGAAVAFLGVGVVEHVRYYTKNHDYNNNPQCGIGDQCKDLADAADTARVVSFVGYGAAAVATGLAIAFWATDAPRAQTEKHAGLGLSCVPTPAGVACSGRF